MEIGNDTENFDSVTLKYSNNELNVLYTIKGRRHQIKLLERKYL